MNLHRKIAGSFCILMISACSSVAGEKEQILIDKVVAAYGGQELLSLKTLRFTDRYKRFRFGQSHSPDEIDLSDNRARVTIDMAGKRKIMQWVSRTTSDFWTQHLIFNGTTGYGIDHSSQTFTENEELNFANTDRRLTYNVDTTLVLLLKDAAASAVHKGDILVGDALHEKLVFTASGSPEMTLFINKQTGLISRMRRADWLPNKFNNYHFSGHKKQDGITYAADTYATRRGQPATVTISRSIEVNPDVTGDFELPKDYQTPTTGKGLDLSEMSVAQVAEGVYLAGQDWGFSLFVDTGDYVIASGGYADLKDRFEAVKAFASIDKPLKYMVVSHHHIDHLGGMNEAAELGANFITLKVHEASIRERVTSELADDRFIFVDGKGSVAEDNVKIFDFPNSHSSHNLIAYYPAAKIIFTADIFSSRQEKGAPDGYDELVTLRDSIAKHGFSTELFAAGHSSRILTKADLETSISQIDDTDSTCPKGWSFCSN